MGASVSAHNVLWYLPVCASVCVHAVGVTLSLAASKALSGCVGLCIRVRDVFCVEASVAVDWPLQRPWQFTWSVCAVARAAGAAAVC